MQAVSMETATVLDPQRKTRVRDANKKYITGGIEGSVELFEGRQRTLKYKVINPPHPCYTREAAIEAAEGFRAMAAQIEKMATELPTGEREPLPR